MFKADDTDNEVRTLRGEIVGVFNRSGRNAGELHWCIMSRWIRPATSTRPTSMWVSELSEFQCAREPCHAIPWSHSV
jgi:hypothetical protein